jgi:hypothetical protein
VLKIQEQIEVTPHAIARFKERVFNMPDEAAREYIETALKRNFINLHKVKGADGVHEAAITDEALRFRLRAKNIPVQAANGRDLHVHKTVVITVLDF